MNREIVIKKTIENLSKLPDSKLEEVSEYAEFLLKRIEDRSLAEGIEMLMSDSKSFEYLAQDEEIYTVNDLKEKYR